jgi:coenzyme PQQ precursor peptide PqqA
VVVGASLALQGNQEAEHMKWRTPKIVEIACGGEINAYFPAEL